MTTEIYILMKGINKEDIHKVLLVRESGRTHRKGFKLAKFRFHKYIGNNWFTNRVVDVWNMLSSRVVSVNTRVTSENRLNEIVDSDIMWG